jgi:hypothetical protein
MHKCRAAVPCKARRIVMRMQATCACTSRLFQLGTTISRAAGEVLAAARGHAARRRRRAGRNRLVQPEPHRVLQSRPLEDIHALHQARARPCSPCHARSRPATTFFAHLSANLQMHRSAKVCITLPMHAVIPNSVHTVTSSTPGSKPYGAARSDLTAPSAARRRTRRRASRATTR